MKFFQVSQPIEESIPGFFSDELSEFFYADGISPLSVSSKTPKEKKRSKSPANNKKKEREKERKL